MQFSLKVCCRKHKILWNIHSSGKWGIIITLLSWWLQNFLLWHTSLLSALDYYSISTMTFSIKHFSTTCFLNTHICCRSFRPWSFFKTFIFKLFSTFITFEILQKKKRKKKKLKSLCVIIISRTSFRQSLHSTVYLNVKELLVRNRSHIWSLGWQQRNSNPQPFCFVNEHSAI